eukprot:gene16372-18014_t
MCSSIKGVTDPLTRTNELLQKERDFSRKLEKEISDLKISLLRQEMENAISRNNGDPLWIVNDSNLRANTIDGHGCLATSIEISDNSSSNSSAEEDMDDWTEQHTRKIQRQTQRKEAAQNAENKQVNKRFTSSNSKYNNRGIPPKEIRKDSNQKRKC